MFAQSAPSRREFDHHVPPHDAQHSATQEHRHTQCSRLPIRLIGRDLMLVAGVVAAMTNCELDVANENISHNILG